MKKFLFALSFILSVINFSSTHAEQLKAAEYRKILSSKNFFVEYEDKNVKKIIAEENGQRMLITDLSGKYKAIVSVLNPVGAFFANQITKFPDFMYCNHKYYKFVENDFAFMANENQLEDENLNPAEEWSAIKKFLSLPDELAVFNWHDEYHKISSNITEPVFSGSLQKDISGKTYDCDRYISQAKNSRSNISINFDMCYENGELVLIQSSIFANNKEYPVNVLKIKKISAQIPKDSIKLDKNAKVYAAGIGDMNDLLEKPVLIGKLQDVMK